METYNGKFKYDIGMQRYQSTNQTKKFKPKRNKLYHIGIYHYQVKPTTQQSKRTVERKSKIPLQWIMLKLVHQCTLALSWLLARPQELMPPAMHMKTKSRLQIRVFLFFHFTNFNADIRCNH